MGILRNEHCSFGSVDLLLSERVLGREREMDYIQAGLVSSHFFFRLLQVMHPVLLRPFGCFILNIDGGFGCFLGRPRGLLATAPLEIPGDAVSPSWLSSGGVSAFASINSSSSSISSTFGTTSSLEGEGGVPLSM